MESLLKLFDLDWKVPNSSTLCRQQKTLSIAIPYQVLKGSLNLFVDGTSIKAESLGDWGARKHGGVKLRLRRKMHIQIDEETLDIRAVEVTNISIRDPPILPYFSRLSPKLSENRQFYSPSRFININTHFWSGLSI